jgi:hypothetical protein
MLEILLKHGRCVLRKAVTAINLATNRINIGSKQDCGESNAAVVRACRSDVFWNLVSIVTYSVNPRLKNGVKRRNAAQLVGN